MRFPNAVSSLVLCLCFSSAFGQVAKDDAGKKLIKLNVVVTSGKNGEPVAEIAQNDFTVLDNGAPQSIRDFRAVVTPAEAVQVLIVIDAVNVDFQHVAYEREQIDRFLRANNGQLAQPTAMAIFTDGGTQVQPAFSKDGNALSAMLDKQVIGLRDLRRSSGFYGAEDRLDLSIKTVDQLLSRAGTESGRKFILWVSPGWPLLSGPGIQLSSKDQQRLFHQVINFSEGLRRTNTTMYVVDPLGAAENPGRTFYYEQFLKGLKKPADAELGDVGVQVLAVQSGGLFLSGNNDLTQLLQRCYADASAFYEMSYEAPPAEHANEYHHIEVRMAEPHLTARSQQGYYAQP